MNRQPAKTSGNTPLPPAELGLHARFPAELEPDASFPRENRIVKAAEFRHIMDHGAKIVSREAVCFFMVKDALTATQGSQCGIIASKAVGNAVARNRCKRLIREAFRQVKGRSDNPFQGLQLVVIARQACLSRGSDGIIRSLIWALNQYRAGFRHDTEQRPRNPRRAKRPSTPAKREAGGCR